jgi:hypothetical protein
MALRLPGIHPSSASCIQRPDIVTSTIIRLGKGTWGVACNTAVHAAIAVRSLGDTPDVQNCSDSCPVLVQLLLLLPPAVGPLALEPADNPPRQHTREDLSSCSRSGASFS